MHFLFVVDLTNLICTWKSNFYCYNFPCQFSEIFWLIECFISVKNTSTTLEFLCSCIFFTFPISLMVKPASKGQTHNPQTCLKFFLLFGQYWNLE